MSYPEEISPTRKVITRKDHHCITCYALVPKGSEMYTQTLVGDNGIYEWRECLACEEALKIKPLYKAAADFDYDGCILEGCIRSLIEELAEEGVSDHKTLVEFFTTGKGSQLGYRHWR